MNGIDTYSSTSVSQNNGLNMIKLMTGHAETISTVQLNKSLGEKLISSFLFYFSHSS